MSVYITYSLTEATYELLRLLDIPSIFLELIDDYMEKLLISACISTAPQVFRQPFLLHFIISSKKCLQKSPKVQHHSVNLQNTCKSIIDYLIKYGFLNFVLVATRAL